MFWARTAAVPHSISSAKISLIANHLARKRPVVGILNISTIGVLGIRRWLQRYEKRTIQHRKECKKMFRYAIKKDVKQSPSPLTQPPSAIRTSHINFAR